MQRGADATGKDEKGIFRFNSVIEQKTFPDYNPYTIRRCRDCDIAKGSVNGGSSAVESLAAFIPQNELCQACQFLHLCEIQRYKVVKEFENGGRVSVHQLVSSKDSDYNKLIQIAEFFAKTFAEDVKLTPKMSRPPQFVYQNICQSLMGTIYEGKCPDLLVGTKWYEHEGFVTDNAKRAFSNMMNHGLKQSTCIIIDKPELTDRYMLRSIKNRISIGEKIDEVWLRDEAGEIILLYKTTDD